MTETERRADAARQLLDSELLTEFLTRLENDAINEMVKAPLWTRWADRKRRTLVDRVRIIRGFRAQLQSLVMAGEEAARNTRTLV